MVHIKPKLEQKLLKIKGQSFSHIFEIFGKFIFAHLSKLLHYNNA